jgi:hypothetical protein
MNDDRLFTRGEVMLLTAMVLGVLLLAVWEWLP